MTEPKPFILQTIERETYGPLNDTRTIYILKRDRGPEITNFIVIQQYGSEETKPLDFC